VFLQNWIWASFWWQALWRFVRILQYKTIHTLFCTLSNSTWTLNRHDYPSASHVTDACGGVFDVSNGTITSPSFPELYPSNKNCVWEIIAPPQYRITLNFTHFELEGNNVSKWYYKKSTQVCHCWNYTMEKKRIFKKNYLVIYKLQLVLVWSRKIMRSYSSKLHLML
jgi:hypothetical protein